MARNEKRSGARSSVRRTIASLNGDGRYGAALLVAAACLLLPSAGGSLLRDALRYERAALAAGEYWRLLTAHVVHLDASHAALNTLGLVLIWGLFARDYAPRRWIVIALASILAIDAGLWWLAPQVEWYVGASGVLHGALAAGTLAHLRRRDFDGWILAAFLIGKLAIEQRVALPFAGDAPVIVAAHLYGAIGGLAAALCLPSRREPL